MSEATSDTWTTRSISRIFRFLVPCETKTRRATSIEAGRKARNTNNCSISSTKPAKFPSSKCWDFGSNQFNTRRLFIKNFFLQPTGNRAHKSVLLAQQSPAGTQYAIVGESCHQRQSGFQKLTATATAGYLPPLHVSSFHPV